MILAQIDKVNPTFLHQFALVCLGLLGGVAAAVGIWAAVRKRPISPQPLVTKEEERFATRDFVAERADEVNRRLAGHDQDIRDLYAELKRDREASEIHASQRSSAIYQEIGTVREGLSKKIDAQTSEFHQAIRDLPAQLIAMLRNTGVIK